MPVSNKHLNEMCQVWDGLTLGMMPNAEAEKAEKDGKVQRTRNLTSAQLKRPEEFRKRAPRRKKKQNETSHGLDDQTYRTRDMKPNGDR